MPCSVILDSKVNKFDLFARLAFPTYATQIIINYRAFCKTKIFVQNQGMQEILPQAYNWYPEDKILSITQSLGEKIVLQMALHPTGLTVTTEFVIKGELWEAITDVILKIFPSAPTAA